MIFSCSDIAQALANLHAQKTRTMLTALGIVFGVGSVIGMLSIGAGAREESLRFIEQLGVRNILVDSRPTTSREELQQRRRSSPGLSDRDVRILRANIDALELLSARRTLHPVRVLPKPAHDVPELYGVNPSYAAIHSLRLAEGNFFSPFDDDSSANVCVLGESAKVSLLGYDPAIGKSVKINDTWLQVVGVLNEQLMAGSTNSGASMQDVNNIVYIPLNTFQYRFWDTSASMKDDLDGIELRLRPGADSIEVAKVVTAVLNSTHHATQDFSVTIPAALLAQQQRTQTIFTYVGSHRRHLAVSRRHRHHEHRPGDGAGAHPRNRHSPLHRRPPFRHRAPVSDGIGSHLGWRRLTGNQLRFLSSLADRPHRRMEDHRHHGVGGNRLRGVGRRRGRLRNLPRREGLAHQPHRRPSLRIAGLGKRTVVPHGSSSPGQVDFRPGTEPLVSRRWQMP